MSEINKYEVLENVPGFSKVPQGIRESLSDKEKLILLFFANSGVVTPEKWNRWANQNNLVANGEERDRLMEKSLICQCDGGHEVGGWFEGES